MDITNDMFYDMLAQMERRYPGRSFLKPAEIATELGCNIKTVRAAIERKHNPLPARNIGQGLHNKTYIIPIAPFIRWSLGRRV